MLQVGHPGSSVIHPNSPFCTGQLPRVCSLHGRRQFLRALAKYELKTAKNGRGKQEGASADRPEVWANEGEKVPENAQLKAYLRCRIFTSTVGYGKVSRHQCYAQKTHGLYGRPGAPLSNVAFLLCRHRSRPALVLERVRQSPLTPLILPAPNSFSLIVQAIYVSASL